MVHYPFSLLATLLPLPFPVACSFAFSPPSTPTELLQISQLYQPNLHSAKTELFPSLISPITSYNQTGTAWTHRVSAACRSSPTCPHSWQAPCVPVGPESAKCFTHSVHILFHPTLKSK